MRGRRTVVSRSSVAAALAITAITVACTPGGTTTQVSAPPAPAVTGVTETGPVTLTVWDQECCGQNKVWDQLNSEFEAKYPNVTIKRVNRDLGELKTLLKLAISGPNAPDVVEANQGWPDMGGLVKAGLLLPLDNYAQAYGWRNDVSENVLAVSSWSPDGKQFGTGNLYGYTAMGEIIGVYYNKQKLATLGLQVPTSFDEFQQDLEAAKQAGEIPIQYADSDAFPGIHELGAVQGAMAPASYMKDLVFGTQGANLSFDTPQNVQAAGTLQDWANRGYFTPGFGGAGYDNAVADFAKGQGVFMITGNWIVGDLGPDSTDFGFFVMPPVQAGGPEVAMGGAGYPLSITARSEHPDAAAAYIDWMTSSRASDLLLQTGQLPLRNDVEMSSVQPGTVLADVVDAAQSLSKSNGIVPYEDWATPTFYDTLTAAIQELTANRLTSQEFVAKVQQDYSDFQRSRS
jgi:raffinose/stachyose/melibiose transport system substrate-binding protein